MSATDSDVLRIFFLITTACTDIKTNCRYEKLLRQASRVSWTTVTRPLLSSQDASPTNSGSTRLGSAFGSTVSPVSIGSSSGPNTGADSIKVTSRSSSPSTVSKKKKSAAVVSMAANVESTDISYNTDDGGYADNNGNPGNADYSSITGSSPESTEDDKIVDSINDDNTGNVSTGNADDLLPNLESSLIHLRKGIQSTLLSINQHASASKEPNQLENLLENSVTSSEGDTTCDLPTIFISPDTSMEISCSHNDADAYRENAGDKFSDRSAVDSTGLGSASVDVMLETYDTDPGSYSTVIHDNSPERAIHANFLERSAVSASRGRTATPPKRAVGSSACPGPLSPRKVISSSSSSSKSTALVVEDLDRELDSFLHITGTTSNTRNTNNTSNSSNRDETADSTSGMKSYKNDINCIHGSNLRQNYAAYRNKWMDAYKGKYQG